jgi:hypothetical protein
MSPASILTSGQIGRAARALKNRLPGARRGVLAAVLAAVILAMAGCGSSHPRTEVLRSANPLTSDIYVRITGPGGAVSYTGQRFITYGEFSKYNLRKDRRGGLFVPPRILDRKLCASTHVIRRADAPELQRWRGRTLAVTVYGKKSSAIFCAVLGRGIYRGGS